VPKTTENHDDKLVEMVRQVQSKLLGIEIMNGLKKIDLPGLDLMSAKEMAEAALAALEKGQLGYAVITAERH
jgi:hypothetical protein